MTKTVAQYVSQRFRASAFRAFRISRLKAEDGGSIDIGGATLAAAAMRAGLIDEYAIVTHPVMVGGGTPFFTALDNWVSLTLVATRTFLDGVALTRYETRR